MTATELSAVIDYIKARYPNTGIYRHWEEVARDFAMLPAETVHEAARAHYDAGNKHPPSFAELRSEAAKMAATRGLTDPTSTSCEVRGRHSRNRAITDLGDGQRESMCLDCHSTVIRAAHKLPTVGETAIIVAEGKAPPAPPDDIADRIAP